MVTTARFVAGARMVRISAATFVIVLLVGFIAITSFAGHYGEPAPMRLDTKSNDVALAAAIQEQEAAGLSCTEKPSLAEVVLFQHKHAGRVTILTFDEAIEASSTRSGWIRRYCINP